MLTVAFSLRYISMNIGSLRRVRAWGATVEVSRASQELLEPGVSLSWTGLEQVTFHCGNAGGIRVTVNGEEIGALGDLDQVVDWVVVWVVD